MLRNAWISVMLFLVIGSSSSPAVAEDDRTQWTQILSGMRFERQRLQSGSFAGIGSDDKVISKKSDIVEPIEIFCQFDFADDSILFETRGRGKLERDGEYVEGDTFRFICLQADRTYHYTNLRPYPALHICPPATLEIVGQHGTRGHFEPRAIGLLRIDDQFRGVEFDVAFEQWASQFEEGSLEITNEGAGIVRVTHFFKALRNVWIDTKHGYTLLKTELLKAVLDPKTGDLVPASRFFGTHPELLAKMGDKASQANTIVDTMETVDLSWKMINDVWVPTSHKHVFFAPAGTREEPFKSKRSEWQMSYNWTSVNEPISPVAFEPNSFGLPDKTPIFDRRKGKPVQVGRILSRGPIASRTGGAGWISRTNTVIAVVVAALAGAVIYRRRRAR